MSNVPRGHGPVLDYASPRPHGKIRLPSQSRIEMTRERDDVLVHEWLAAKAAAIFAMVFAGGSLALLPCIYVVQESPHWKSDFAQGPIATAVGMFLILALLVGGIIVLLLVVNNTWRNTYLEARGEGLVIRFESPFEKKRHEFYASEVEEVRLESTTTEADRNHLSEIQIHIAAFPVIKLFTDHATHDLEPIAAAVRQAIGRESTAATR